MPGGPRRLALRLDVVHEAADGGEIHGRDLRRLFLDHRERPPVEGLDGRALLHPARANRGDELAGEVLRAGGLPRLERRDLGLDVEAYRLVPALRHQPEPVGEPRYARAVHGALLRPALGVGGPRLETADVVALELGVGEGPDGGTGSVQESAIRPACYVGVQ